MVKMPLKASSLINAIFICVIISIFCSCFILVSHFQNMLNDRIFMQERLMSQNQSALNYFLINNQSIQYDNIEEIELFEDGIMSFIEKKKWGFYDVLICKTAFNNDTVSKIVLIGTTQTKSSNLALFATNYDKPLKLSGAAKIIGDVKIPMGNFGQAHINGSIGNSIIQKGKQIKSEDKFPKIDKDMDINIAGLPRLSLTKLHKDSLAINGFDKPTKVLDLNSIEILKDINCKGNFILVSDRTLEIDKSSKLNDVLIIAPKVKIGSGFKGNLQIIAKEEVVIDEDVELLYPSSIYIKHDEGLISVGIKRNSTVMGGIVIAGKADNKSLEHTLTIEENALVVGTIYCYGSTQLKGELIGRIYSDRFFLKTDASNYENVILNGSIDRESLSKDFIELPLFNTISNDNKYAVIKEF